MGEGKTLNVQHRIPNAEAREDSRCHSMFGVGCSVPCTGRNPPQPPFRLRQGYGGRVGHLLPIGWAEGRGEGVHAQGKNWT